MRWKLPDKKVEGSLLEHILQMRNISPSNRSSFLNPDWQQIHSPTMLFDTQAATEAILEAKEKRQKVFIHGDFDVDGVCATAIMWDFLFRQLGMDVVPYIPSRFDEGYGLSPASLDAILGQGGNLVITVDCGVKNLTEIEIYRKKGLEFVITDHHTLPVAEDGKSIVSSEAHAVVHPRHPGGNYPFPEISGSAVAWKLVQVIAETAGLDPQQTEYLDLVALATICDVMPLVDENRALVSLGLKEMRRTERVGLLALFAVAGVEREAISAYHPGFVLGPRLNSAGRLDTAMTALRLLSTQNYDSALSLAQQLHNLNAERQEMTQKLMLEADAQIASQNPKAKLFFIYGDGWPEGIIGLVAGKLTEKYHRPVLVGSQSEGIIKGSARGIEGFHLADALKKLDRHLQRHGGHALAAGFALALENVELFKNDLLGLVEESLTADSLEKILEIDAVIESANLPLEEVAELSMLEPFGFGNKTPTFALLNQPILSKFLMGKEKKHLKLKLGALDVVAFNASPDWLDLELGSLVSVVGSLSVNEWNGNRNIQLVVKDLLQGEIDHL